MKRPLPMHALHGRLGISSGGLRKRGKITSRKRSTAHDLSDHQVACGHPPDLSDEVCTPVTGEAAQTQNDYGRIGNPVGCDDRVFVMIL